MNEHESKADKHELATAIESLRQTFIQRWDRYARQLEDGSYVAIQKPLRVHHLEAHLKGELTLGAYVLDEKSQGRYLVLDADDAPDRRWLQALATVLAEWETPSYMERSRRGAHLWLFFDSRDQVRRSENLDMDYWRTFA